MLVATNANNSISGTFFGSGAGLTGLNADMLDNCLRGLCLQCSRACRRDIATGTLADERLSANVALLGANQLFSGSNQFSGVLVATNANNSISGTFFGSARA